jgi:hypothetical protein
MSGWKDAKIDADLVRCREIADDFIISIQWDTVTAEESVSLVQMLKRYPRESIEIAMLPGSLTREDWIQ